MYIQLLLSALLIGGTDPAALNQSAARHHWAGRWDWAAPLFRLAFREANRTGAPPEVRAVIASNVGAANKRLGRLEEAAQAYRKALELRVEAFGASHPETALPMNNLAEVHRLAGRERVAAALLSSALSILGSAPSYRAEYRIVRDNLNEVRRAATERGVSPGASISLVELYAMSVHPRR
jgi:Flp pilus assembly protein TadD